MAFLDPRITNENGAKKAQVNEEKKEEKIRLSRLDDLGLCPHKAFPSKPIDRSKFESHSQYLEFLTQLKSYDKPWFIPPPTIAKRKLKLKPMQIINVHPLKKKTANKDHQEEFEDLSKYLVLQNTCENLEKCRKKRKKSKRLSKSGVGYSLKVTDDLAFLLRTMADAREHLVQKAIENKWREEEEERIAKEKGDIQALKNIVEGMMIKFIKIEEERLAQREMKEKQGPDDEKRHRRSSTKSDDVSQVPGSDNQELTKDLVGFLKSLLEADIKRKERIYEEKNTSITDLDQFLQSQEEADKIEEEAKQEEVEEEEKEKEEKEVGDEEKEPGLDFEIEDNKENEEKNDDDKKTDEGEGNIENEPNVDMHEVNKKLEDLVMGAEGLENEEKQVEEEEVEAEIEEWVKSIISPRPSPKIKVEASTQFDYALERKLALGIDREPKDFTEDNY
ncbi:myb-like protein X [Nilaparvata lugens]|uniref:myb-like protein X n=1 Tax=Nilaparvata lugens TaxID=108931 RepID=UPI00193EBD5B|nr:myb-like protein X [Nilaparvata lugens]